MSQLFAFYMDESGSPKPDPKDGASYFAVGGVLINHDDEKTIFQMLSDFKKRWGIDEKIALHGNEIRSRKRNFAWLGRSSKDEQERFLSDLSDVIIQCPIIVHGCVISRKGYLDRYLERYGSNTWEMMKSAFSILIERVAKYVLLQNGKVMIYFEKAGKKEDRLITHYFKSLRDSGAPFNAETSSKYSPLTPIKMEQVLAGIEGKSKSHPIIQIADSCLHPVAKSKEQPENQAFQALLRHNKLVDTHLRDDSLHEMGIKYYCFDNLH
ncbi:DUF3800 domain-containing protein [Thermosynechococcus sp. HN-54]|uniref:DUF3800 domain-containing protein n=1 Tax=Thermosynechococcus sp. HN-54 TaxID=2933959 RepID=UPI00202D08D4|nr:DUF3800 domain-containing protein [Thermosynechococcus sp. HN-54]URR36106.1 DUF3800 domain-containing protein [Thermosynechococcus sp. HN-54]